MQFRVLGPVRVVAGDPAAEADLTPRLRTVLAVLLWQANRAVPVDELADFVWDGVPPAGVTAALRAPGHATATATGGAGRRADRNARPGYAIEVASDEMDASRLQVLTQRADAAIRAGQWAEASRTAAEALGLWRGAPLAECAAQLQEIHRVYRRAATAVERKLARSAGGRLGPGGKVRYAEGISTHMR